MTIGPFLNALSIFFQIKIVRALTTDIHMKLSLETLFNLEKQYMTCVNNFCFCFSYFLYKIYFKIYDNNNKLLKALNTIMICFAFISDKHWHLLTILIKWVRCKDPCLGIILSQDNIYQAQHEMVSRSRNYKL